MGDVQENKSPSSQAKCCQDPHVSRTFCRSGHWSPPPNTSPSAPPEPRPRPRRRREKPGLADRTPTAEGPARPGLTFQVTLQALPTDGQQRRWRQWSLTQPSSTRPDTRAKARQGLLSPTALRRLHPTAPPSTSSKSGSSRPCTASGGRGWGGGTGVMTSSQRGAGTSGLWVRGDLRPAGAQKGPRRGAGTSSRRRQATHSDMSLSSCMHSDVISGCLSCVIDRIRFCGETPDEQASWQRRPWDPGHHDPHAQDGLPLQRHLTA